MLHPRRPTTHVVTVKIYGFLHGPWNGFAQPWCRVWPCMAVPSQPLQSHNDGWSTFTPALSARSRHGRNVTPLGVFEQSGEAPVGFIMSVRPSTFLPNHWFFCASLWIYQLCSQCMDFCKKVIWGTSVTICREDSYLGKIGQKTPESLHEDLLMFCCC